MSPTGNKHDLIAGVELALADYHCLFGQPLADACPIDEVTGEVLPVVTIVTDNGGPFRIVGLLVVHHGPSGVSLSSCLCKWLGLVGLGESFGVADGEFVEGSGPALDGETLNQ